MELERTLSYAIREAGYALSGAEARDHLHVRPDLISRAAAARMVRSLRALEDFVSRIIIALALQLEHVITVDMTELPYPKRRKARAPRNTGRIPTLEMFRERSDSHHPKFQNLSAAPAEPDRGPVNPAKLYDRITRLRALLDAPEARARRYAHTLARRKHYKFFAPGPARLHARFGTALTTMYHAIGSRILSDSRKRPPPCSPRPRPPPRVLFP